MEIKKTQGIDRVYLTSILLLTIGGFFVFSSASLGLLARDGASFQSVALSQTLGLIIGVIGFWIMSKINYKFWRKHAFYIFIAAILLNVLLFIPALSLNHGGASRWIDLRFITFQPSEFLKIAFIIYFASWIASVKEKITSFKLGILPYIVIVGLLCLLLLSQSDTDTFVVIAGTGIAMLFAGGGRLRDMVVLILGILLLVGAVVYFRPYARARIMTFIHPTSDSQGAGYQIQQSLIAIGSGQITGRGYGQSIQKFNYLPQPIDDSIFAVAAEEFGFIGSLVLLGMFLLFAFRSFKIAAQAPDTAARLMVIGIAILILVESFMNISSMLGILPLAGMPLLFVSHGGTALIITLAAAGIIANISRHPKNA